MASYSDVCVLLPTLNESATIAEVIDSYRDAGFETILVVDGGSDDGTRTLAREAGARVMTQSGSGKGQALREAVATIDARYVLLVDADQTYRAEDADRMLEPLLAGECDHVIGNRFADMQPGAMTRLNRFGNRLINRAFQVIHGENYVDILSGYRAFTVDSFRQLTLSADGFGIETEMAVECAKNNVRTSVIPVTYRPRPDGSSTNLHPIKDGGIIFLELYRKAKTSNPLFYFGSIGLVSTLTGLVLAAFVIARWLFAGVGHEIIAVGAAAATLFGVQLLMFGFLADLILSLHREQAKRIDRLTPALGGRSPDAEAPLDESSVTELPPKASHSTTSQPSASSSADSAPSEASSAESTEHN